MYMMDYKNILKSLVDTEKESTSSKNAQERYLRDHANRFDTTIELCKDVVPSEDAKVLDIGRSYFTSMLAQYYNNVTSLGFPLDSDDGGHREKEEAKQIGHIEFDLTNSKDFEQWPKPDIKFDLIVYAETIEHIYIAPEFTLLMLRSLLTENGKLIITTPNATAFHKRIRLLLGRNPYEKIRYFDQNPGHYREYTMKELTGMCTKSGFSIYSAVYKNYSNIKFFSSLSSFKYIFIKPFEVIPSFKDTLIVVATG